mmetsp:Transcript_43273/g.122591  ORF Transcript_43273/g.122591 Transcript_43273/m.122591 type:complete len:551 (-) Transcript_43273:111-1763(-)
MTSNGPVSSPAGLQPASTTSSGVKMTPDPHNPKSPNLGPRSPSPHSHGDPNVENDPRYITFPTAADEGDEEEHLLGFDYNQLPTYPVRPSFKDKPEEANMDTHIVAFDPCKLDPYHPTSMPIYQTATFQQPSIERFGPYDYTRSGNPTRTAVEELVASLESAHAAFAFNSGMAAMTAMTRLCDIGDEIICSDDIYGGAHRLLTRICAKQGIATRFVDTTDVDEIARVISSKTKIVYIETPSNPLMRISDVRRCADLAHKYKAWLVVDSTMMSPYLMNPIKLGADVIIHSATKFLAGHSDTMAGFVCCSSEDLARQIAFVQNAEGSALSPFDCWLTLRGLKTLAIRHDRMQQTASEIAEFLAKHPLVSKVHYAGHPKDHPEGAFELHKSQSRGGGSVISFETGSVRYSRKICDFCKIFKISVSFGSCNSLIEMPCVLSHASIPKDMRGIPEDIVRLSVGLENASDLLADLSTAMKRALEFFQRHSARPSPAHVDNTDTPSPSTSSNPKLMVNGVNGTNGHINDINGNGKRALLPCAADSEVRGEGERERGR